MKTIGRDIYIDVVRFKWTPETTISSLRINGGDHFAFVLEDALRDPRIKIMHKTAINVPECKARIRVSPKHGKTITLYTERDGITVLNEHGVSFTYINTHGGNRHEHTSGCLLVNEEYGWSKKENDYLAWGNKNDELVEIVEEFINQHHRVYFRFSIDENIRL